MGEHAFNARGNPCTKNMKKLALMPFGVNHPHNVHWHLLVSIAHNCHGLIHFLLVANYIFVHIQHADEVKYKFATPSTMKPTQIKCSEGSINQLPPWTEIQGDIRLTPFYDVDECMKKVMGYVEELNSGWDISDYYVGCVSYIVHIHVDLSLLPTRGPCSKYELDIAEGKFIGKLELIYESDPLRVSD
jgi:acetylornithine deacetylase/succinyl-diaminopimelate desuccinylase-like protein